MTRGWDDDGRGSVIVTASVDRACEGRAIGGGGHDDAASGGWIVALGEHGKDQPLWEEEGWCRRLYTSPRLCVVMTTTSHLVVARNMSDAFADLWSNSAPKKQPPSQDAFSHLLGPAFPTTPSQSQMTIAERAKLVENQKIRSRAATPPTVTPVWDGLDALANPSPRPTPLEDDWGFGPALSQPATRPSSSLRPPALLDDDIHDDILGELARPIESIHSVRLSFPIAPLPQLRPTFQNKPSSNFIDDTSSPSPSPPHHTSSPSRPVSPPPHILGQIVEMGFSVRQARAALAATDTGVDVQAALDTLLSNGSGSSSRRSTPSNLDSDPSPRSPDSRDHALRSASRLIPHDRGTPSPSNRDGDNLPLQDHADKILAQASEIGLSVLNKASTFWKEKKIQVRKAYVDRRAASPGPTIMGGVHSGRPRWMQEGLVADDDGGSKDSLQTDAIAQRKATSPPDLRPSQPTISRTRDLLCDEPVYVSPFRRAKPQPTNPPIAVQAQPPRNRPPHRPSPRIPLHSPLISAPLDSISRSNRHKTSGTEAFNLGQFSIAESHYAKAMAALPPSHLLRIPLHTSRALARIKIGDYPGAVDDCTAALDIVTPHFDPRQETPTSQRGVDRKEEGAGVNLAEEWVNALRRRAEALEGREKWKDAGADWGILAGTEWARALAKGEAERGAGRCRRMVNPDQGASVQVTQARSKPPAHSTRRPAPASVPSALPSRALENLRKANDAAEVEDQQRHELKDGVDAKLLAWKAGKEANIRALLASLDMVLWPELGIAKLGMGDLVTGTQVKGKYLRVIAKLHPDKVCLPHSLFGAG